MTLGNAGGQGGADRLIWLSPASGGRQRADHMTRIIISQIVAGFILALPACAKRPIDILCPPAGECPNAQKFIGGGEN
jgi:hypothetical protein